MARKSRVNIMYQSPYMGRQIPEDQLKLMKEEIHQFRTDLWRKQQRLAKSPDYSANESVMQFLRSDSARISGKNEREIQNLWNRLYTMEQSKNMSISGKMEIENEQIKAFHEMGLDFVDRHNLRTFGEFMNWAKDTYGLVMDSMRIAQFYFNNQGLSPAAIRQAYNTFIDNGAMFGLDEEGYEKYLTDLATYHYNEDNRQLEIYDFNYKKRR